MPAYTSIILYMVFTALSFTFIDKLGDFINPIFSLFFMALCATLWFNLVNYNNLKILYSKCKQHKFLYFLVTLSIGINWLCSIFAPNKSDPFVYLTAGFITSAVLGLLSKKTAGIKQRMLEWMCIVLLVASLISMHFSYTIHHNKSTDLGLILGVVSGASAYYYMIYSGKFGQKARLLPSQILALRFWPLIVALAIYMFTQRLEFSITFDGIMILLFMAFITLIIPVFFLQQAIAKINANTLSIALCATPVITFTIYSISIESLNLLNLGICILITLVLILTRLIAKTLARIKASG